MKHNISYRHYMFYRLLLRSDVSFERVNDEIVIRKNDEIVAFLTFERDAYMQVSFSDGRRGLRLTYHLYRRILSMRNLFDENV